MGLEPTLERTLEATVPMYDVLTSAELAALQDMLFSATQTSYRMASMRTGHPGQTSRFGPVHAETAWLFLEVGLELGSRLGDVTGPEGAPTDPGPVRRR